MSDPLRSEQSGPTDDSTIAEREARIEQLLLSGLDHYFAADYEQAIHVWTRVVFLDRTHDRARAYIERARQALAERQRELEELIHRGVAAFNSGQTDAARQLLNEAIARGGPHDVALTFLDRLNRLDAGISADTTPLPLAAPSRMPVARPTTPAGAAPWRGPWLALIAAVAVLATGALFWWQGPQASWLTGVTRSEGAAPLPAAARPEPLPIPRTAEATLARAQALYDSGRLLDALRTLDAIPLADHLRADADGLRAAIQRDLLAAAAPRLPAQSSPDAVPAPEPPTR